jgi:dihydroflavonol-4-reductase
VRGICEDKVRPIREAVGETLFNQLEIVEADLLNAESLANAIKGATYVVHTASPFPLKQPKNADELVRPAVDGTLAVCRACHANKVKRLVITSSCAAVMDVKPENAQPLYNEENWSDTEH